MELISVNDGLLTNAEVYELIKQHQSNRQAQQPKPLNNREKTHIDLQNREAIERNALQYLESLSHGSNRNLDTGAIRNCLVKLKALGYQFTEAEMMQLSNTIPKHEVDIHLIIEDCFNRFTEEQIEMLLKMFSQELSYDVENK